LIEKLVQVLGLSFEDCFRDKVIPISVKTTRPIRFYTIEEPFFFLTVKK